MTEEQKKRKKRTDGTAKSQIGLMNAGAGAMVGSVLGHPVTGLIAGCLTGGLMNGSGKNFTEN